MSRFNTGPIQEPLPMSPSEATVGFDFGTSSTKVAFRDFGGLQSILVPPAADRLVWPSVVAVQDESLLFGTEAAEADQTRVIRWLKMLLAADEDGVDNVYREEVQRAKRYSGCSVSCLATLYLANLIARVTTQITSYSARRGLPTPELTINMGAPLETFGHGQDSGASHRFEQALFLAREIAPQVPATVGWSLKLAKAAFDRVVAEHPVLPPLKSRSTFVVPETHAAVTGAIIDRHRLAAGNYVVVDIGAGTTDVAVFSYSDVVRKERRWAVTYLADAVKEEASVQADRCVSELIWEAMMRAGRRPPHDTEMLEMARQAKEESKSVDPVTVAGDFHITRRQINESVSELKRRLFDHYKRTVITALKDKTKYGLQQPFSLLMLGGGSRFGPLHGQFVNHLPSPMHSALQPNELWGSLRDRMRLLNSDGTLRDLSQPDGDRMFSLVHGLTTHVVRLPDFWTPGEVENFPPPPPADLLPYVRNDDD